MSDQPRIFFFNDTATTEIYTLSLHDALPISLDVEVLVDLREVLAAILEEQGKTEWARQEFAAILDAGPPAPKADPRSEEHTSELQSRQYLVCRLLLEKKKNIQMERTCYR